MTNREKALAYAAEQHDAFLETLNDLVRIPSISTDPDHAVDMQKTAEWIARRLKTIGINNVTIYPTAGHPIVYGDYILPGSDKPTVLVYGHYDVQPVEPLDLWKTEPFEPTIKGENLYARGASDMKGQVIASLNAIEAVLNPANPRSTSNS